MNQDNQQSKSTDPKRVQELSPGIELVFGLVGPTGVDLERVYDELCSQLSDVGYAVVQIRLSELISEYLNSQSPKFSNEYERIDSLMNQGNQLRELQDDIVGRLGIAEIRSIRASKTGSQEEPLSNTAYIVRSFKRPEEVSLFRTVYGRAFTLISVYSTRSARADFLAKLIGPTSAQSSTSAEELALRLINRDYNEEAVRGGQRVGKTFPMADYFVGAESRPALREHLRRLVRLTFGDPYISPTRDEQAMFFAHAASLRSLDLSRQVGAAIVSSEGDLITTGCNEVPKASGGLYWCDDANRQRDFERGNDSNVEIKQEIIEDAFRRLRDNGWLSEAASVRSERSLAHDALFGETPFFRDSKLFDVIEFGRAVHAEMAAITQAARAGARIQDAKLFCTTFPCHICARHIVSSGIRDVVFIEPYEKSRTKDLYSDSISIEPSEPSFDRVNFRAFVGVAPRSYLGFFKLETGRKSKDGKVLNENEIASHPRVKRFVFSYISAEDIVIRDTARALPTS
jgi:deoxycytidylate deaminase